MKMKKKRVKVTKTNKKKIKIAYKGQNVFENFSEESFNATEDVVEGRPDGGLRPVGVC